MVTKIWITLRKCERRRKERWPRKLELEHDRIGIRVDNFDFNFNPSRFLGEKLEESNGSNVQVEVL